MFTPNLAPFKLEYMFNNLDSHYEILRNFIRITLTHSVTEIQLGIRWQTYAKETDRPTGLAKLSVLEITLREDRSSDRQILIDCIQSNVEYTVL